MQKNENEGEGKIDREEMFNGLLNLSGKHPLYTSTKGVPVQALSEEVTTPPTMKQGGESDIDLTEATERHMEQLREKAQRLLQAKKEYMNRTNKRTLQPMTSLMGYYFPKSWMDKALTAAFVIGGGLVAWYFFGGFKEEGIQIPVPAPVPEKLVAE
jgi:hypothetical protein